MRVKPLPPPGPGGDRPAHDKRQTQPNLCAHQANQTTRGQGRSARLSPRARLAPKSCPPPVSAARLPNVTSRGLKKRLRGPARQGTHLSHEGHRAEGPPAKRRHSAQMSSCESGPRSRGVGGGQGAALAESRRHDRVRDDGNSKYEAERCSAADGALLRETCEYLPRKWSCAALPGSWTGTGRRKRPLQGKPRAASQQKDRLRTVEQRGKAALVPHRARAWRERAEGQRRPAGSGRLPAHTGCRLSTLLQGASRAGSVPPPHQQRSWPRSAICGHREGPRVARKERTSPARQAHKRAQAGSGCARRIQTQSQAQVRLPSWGPGHAEDSAGHRACKALPRPPWEHLPAPPRAPRLSRRGPFRGSGPAAKRQAVAAARRAQGPCSGASARAGAPCCLHTVRAGWGASTHPC